LFLLIERNAPNGDIGFPSETRDTGEDMTRLAPIVPVEVTHDDIERAFPGYATREESPRLALKPHSVKN
jgi:hypothetical protein